MQNSFAVGLRKLAGEAEKAKRLAESKARDEELRVRAQELQAKRVAEEAARLAAERARQQELEEQRAKKAAAKQVRLSELAKEEENRRKVRAEKAKQEKVDRERRADVARVAAHRAELVKISRRIYVDLALAAWDGDHQVQVNGDIDNFVDDLLWYGIEIRRPERLAAIANEAMVGLIKIMKGLSRELGEQNFAEASRNVDVSCVALSLKGHVSLKQTISVLIKGVQAKTTRRIHSIRRNLSNCENLLVELQSRVASDRLKIASNTAENDVAVRNQRLYFGEALTAVKRRLDQIAAYYSAILAHERTKGDVSLNMKANALRSACSKVVHDFDFKRLSNLDVLNLMRLANGLAPHDSLYDFEGLLGRENHGYEWAKIFLADQLVDLTDSMQRDEERLRRQREEIKVNATALELTVALSRNVEACLLDAEKFEEILSSRLEGAHGNQLRFIDGRYVGPVLALLRNKSIDVSSEVAPSYRELSWLYGADGRDFTGYFDIVLSELAKEGARDAKLVVSQIEGLIKIDIDGRVSLVGDICPELLIILLKGRGFDVASLGAPLDGQGTLVISW